MDYLSFKCQDHMVSDLPQIVRVAPVEGCRLRIEFADGAVGVHDLSWALEKTTPMSAPLREQSFFDRVRAEAGALVWPNGFDLSAWNIRKRMENAGELPQPTGQPPSTVREDADLQRVAAWCASRGIEVRRVESKRSQTKTPDLEFLRDGQTVGWCEVKSRQAPTWRAIYPDEDIHAVGAQVLDPAFNSLANYALSAHEQLSVADPQHTACWVVAIVNHDSRVDVFDFREALTGDFFAASGARYPAMKGVSEGALKAVKFEIDLFLWIEDGDTYAIVGEADPERSARTRQLFELNGPRVLWSV